MHWHDHRGQLIPAGVEVRCYGVEHENEDDFWGGQEMPRHENPLFDEGESSRASSSGLLSSRVKWGVVLGEHAAKLSAMLARSAAETATFHPGSAAFMSTLSRSAAGLTRATDDTYKLVAALYLEALTTTERARPASYVRARLVEQHGYELKDNASHRTKVRQWIGEARKRGYLPPATRTRRNS